MRRRLYPYIWRVLCFLLTVVAGLAITPVKKQLVTSRAFSSLNGSVTGREIRAQEDEQPAETVGERRPADFFVDGDELRSNDYTLRRRIRKVRLDYPEETSTPTQWVDVSYVTLKKEGKLLRKFDANVYFGLGNSADMGFFPFLGGASQEVFISQDVPRGGCQWIVTLSPQFRVIFDGQEFGVGREASDLSAIDLDKDGVYEILVPITDFYELQDKMSMAQIPLPEIVFKYDGARGKYLPANPLFQDHLLKGMTEQDVGVADELNHRSIVLDRLLALIYAGKRKDAWEYFDHSYKLSDKEEIRRRVKAILNKQLVYKFIYNQRRNK